MLLKEVFIAIYIRYWKCFYRGHFQLHMQGFGNAPVGGNSSYTYKALEILL
jgi:hypothetical protein